MAVMGMSMNAQNNCGTDGHEADVTWELNGSELIFSGTGEIKTYSSENPCDYPWYAHANDIQTVIIGEGITNIPDWAFAMYGNLVSIHLPSTLKSIGNSALEETILWNVSLPEGLETIGHYAFMMCPFMSLCLPSTVTFIGQSAFAYCDDLTTVGCYAVDPPVFYDNTVFNNCTKIATVYVQSAKVDDYKAADGWKEFGDKIQSPAGYCGPDGSDEDSDGDVTKATWTFDMATRTLTIEGTKMGQYNRPWESAGMGGIGGGFNPDNNIGYPQGIYHIVIGEGITTIPAGAFYMEVGVTDVILPSTLTAIGENAFGENFNLKALTINAVLPPTIGEYVFFDCPSISTIYVPSGALAGYKAADGWSTYSSNIVEFPLSYSGGDYTFSRTGMTANACSTICLPFDYSVPAGCTFYEFTDVNKDGGDWVATFTAISGTPVANTPYIFRNTGTSVTITKTTGGVDYSGLEPNTTVGSWTFQGTYKAMGFNSPVGYYGYAGQATATATAGQFVHLVSGASAAPFRAYLKCTDTSHELYKARTRGGDGDAQPQTIIVRLISASGEATNIGTIDTRTGEMNLDGESLYSLDGRKLTVKPSKKGVYINNGKSILVK